MTKSLPNAARHKSNENSFVESYPPPPFKTKKQINSESTLLEIVLVPHIPHQGAASYPEKQLPVRIIHLYPPLPPPKKKTMVKKGES